MEVFEKRFHINGGDFASAGNASKEIKKILKKIGINDAIILRIGIASYEAEMNLVLYAYEGDAILRISEEKVELIFEDRGPGIPDIELAMQEGYSTATPQMREMGFGAGMGLPNIKKNSDEFNISSEVNKGTTLQIIFNLK